MSHQPPEAAPTKPQLWVEKREIVSEDGKQWVSMITPLQRQNLQGPWTTWGKFPAGIREDIWCKFLDEYSIREGTILVKVKKAWNKKAAKCYNDALRNARKWALKKSGTDDKEAWKPYKPKWLSMELWHGMVNSWMADPLWDSKSRMAKQNGSSRVRRMTIT